MKKVILILLCLALIAAAASCAGETRDARAMAREALDNAGLTRTEAAYAICDNALDHEGQGIGTGEEFLLYHMLVYAAEQAVNPISAFLALNEAGHFSEDLDRPEEETQLIFPLRNEYTEAAMPELDVNWEVKTYEYTEDGAGQLLQDALELCLKSGSGLSMERKLLDAEGNLNGSVFCSEEDQCLYSYHIWYGASSAYVLCSYFRTADGLTISDVELQLMCCDYLLDGTWTGSTQVLRSREITRQYQFLALIAAVEHVMVGYDVNGWDRQDGFDDARVLPKSYELEEYDVTIDVRRFTQTDELLEWVDLYNYRIR